MKQIAKFCQLLILLSAFVFPFANVAAQSSALGNATTRTYSDGLLDLRGPVNLSLDDTNTTKTKFTTYFANRIARENGRLWVWKAGKFVLLDSASGGVDTTSLSNRIDARVKYSDTASMLLPYARKQALNDTASALRAAIASATPSIDTTLYSTRAWRKKGDDSLGILIATKQGYSDTTTYDATKKNLADTAAALRAAIGSGGGGGGDTSTPFVPLTFSNPIRTTKDKVSVTATSYTTIYIDSSSNGDVGMVDMQNPALNTIRLDGVLGYNMPRSTNDLLTWVNVGGTIKWDVINYAATSGVYQAVAPIGDTLTFALRGAGFTGYTGNYATTGSSGIAVSTEFLSGEGYIQFDAPTTGVFGIGLDSVYSLEAWLSGTIVNYNYSAYFASTNVYANTLGEDLSVADITAIGSGGIMRFGRNASDQMYLSLSTDGGSTYSVIYTFPGTSTAPMYVKLSGFSGSATITNLRRFF